MNSLEPPTTRTSVLVTRAVEPELNIQAPNLVPASGILIFGFSPLLIWSTENWKPMLFIVQLACLTN